MGKCYNCQKELTLREEETHCDNCKILVRYWCNNCKQPFDIIDKESNEKLKECGICGFFTCPNCGVCWVNCEKNEWAENIKTILPEISEEKLKIILKLIENIKIGKEQRVCDRNVPISYAKTKIKEAFGRMEGIKCKNPEDIALFKERIKKILEIKEGETFNINQIRQEGNYGQEERDVINFLICCGEMEEITIINPENKKRYSLFKKIKIDRCPYLDAKNLIIKKCEQCKKIFDREIEYCPNCKYKKTTKLHKMGEAKKLVTKTSNKDICQCERGKFLKKEEINGRKVRGTSQ